MKRKEMKVVLKKCQQRHHPRKVSDHSIRKGPFAKAVTPKRKSRRPLSLYKADMRETRVLSYSIEGNKLWCLA